ncbi:LexA family protein [Ignavigranum ruoffiae]|uniref:Repressor LexA n=1 Tax=Ignavigranum ruoffiae TaxID=89093 RepID=A0A1H9BWJ0_9LACT|nr:LexA family transcriptional regulator [Ignavigranum ruoffiae]UPQ86412.1 helix-turn-helix domain-containing protein [Ignavigranum ruoffiae]SEP93254.1 repressor LexA [Ignavigranum ruoffiae]
MEERVSSGVRLNQIMSQRNLKQIDILNMSKKYQDKYSISLSKSALSQYVNGKQEPDQHRIYLLSKTLNVSEAWLMGFDVPMERNDLPKNVTEIPPAIRIPVLGLIACGEPILADENISEYRETFNRNLPKGDLFFLRAKGDSMAPNIPDGSYVMIRHQEDVENGEIAAVLVNGDEEATLKKVRKLGDSILLEAINEDYAPYLVNKNNPARIIGKAVKVEYEL